MAGKQRSTSRGRNLRKKVLLMLMGSLAGVLACEFLLRVQEPFLHIMARDYQRRTAVGHPIWNHWAPPNIDVTLAAQDLDAYRFFTNSYGCRYPRDVAVPKPSNVTRILVMGDSFTEGYNYDDTVAVTLERRLNESFQGQQFEVINAGCTTYSPILIYLRLKHQLLELQPDYLIVNIDLTDVFDDYWRYRPIARFAEDGEPLAVPAPPDTSTELSRAKDWIKDQSYFLRVVSSIRGKLRGYNETFVDRTTAELPRPTAENIFVYHSTLQVDSERWVTEVKFCLENISRLTALCKEKEIPLAITMYPHRPQIDADSNTARWHRAFETKVKELCASAGVQFYSAFDGVADAVTRGEQLYRQADIHLTSAGQRLWGKLISDFFVDTLDKLTTGTDN